MMKNRLSTIYQQLGEAAVINIGGVPKDVYVQQHDDLNVDISEYAYFKAIATDAEGVSAGDTITIGAATYTIHNHDLSDDGLEIYMAVDRD